MSESYLHTQVESLEVVAGSVQPNLRASSSIIEIGG